LDNQKTDTKIIQNEENERLPLYEHITENGILFWHSQPAQKQQDPQIKAFIDHDYLKNSIYLFLRTEKGRQYTYLGRLARVSYNRDTEKPVWFKWQILEWELEEQKAKEIGLILESDYLSTLDNVRKANTLNFTDPPEQKIAPPQAGESTPDFVARKNIDFADDEKKKREIGLAGEELVVALEKEKLREHGRSDLVGEIHHISKTKGDGAGYDIKSVTPNREIKYIEVKTTVGGLNTSFDITINELNFSKQFAQYYYLYRIYNFDKITKSGDCYVFRGDISRHYFLKPKKFKCDPQIKAPQSSDLDYIPGTIMKPKN
jgi:hypothetical protein